MMPDFWRYVAFGQAMFVALLTLFIIVRYTYLIKKTPSKDRALPFHIICISSSYLTLTIAALFELRLRLGLPYTWRTPTYLAAFTIGDIGLIFMLIHLAVKRILIQAILAQAIVETKAELERKHQENKNSLQEIKTAVVETQHMVESVVANGER